ncbi:MAG: dTMP kinase [bacterium]
MEGNVKGCFITFEGIEGSGKTTQIKLLSEQLVKSGYQVVVTREPGDGEIGSRIRELLLSVSSSLDALTELFLLAADRTRHVIEVISPALEKGKIVISDRYTDSSVAYQGFGRGLPLDFVNKVNDLATNGLYPDLTIVLDIDPTISLERSRSRLRQQNMFEAEGRFERENMSFHQRVRQGYLNIARMQPHRFVVLDAASGVFSLSERVLKIIMNMIQNRMG